MAQVICKKCKQEFDADDKEHYVAPSVAGVAGIGVGAYIGSSIGIATGGWGIAATIPLGLGLGVISFLTADKFRKCPHCGEIFKI
jgi:DNA-directed RNA polymerase subunit RPC12/RpoP